jgi:3-deoxy-manno-octulosonate cytidylyltransferase (CMP-KDO synthetase)
VERRRILGVIPARLGSERLPGKPLVPIAGRPLIEWVWRRVSAFETLDACVVATDAEPVAALCRAVGAAVEMTSPDHVSGTDRVAELARMPRYAPYDVWVNIQGDEPLVDEVQVLAAVEQVKRGWDIGTVATPVRTLEAWLDPSVVKVTRRSNGAALYFSRAPIPHKRGGTPTAAELSGELYLRHVGVYAFQREALLRWVNLPVSPLEAAERLEQLRPLAAGLTIGVGLVAHAEGGVDTPEDVQRVEARLREPRGTELSGSART